MKIKLFCFFYNEAVLLPFFLSHYRWVDEIPRGGEQINGRDTGDSGKSKSFRRGAGNNTRGAYAARINRGLGNGRPDRPNFQKMAKLNKVINRRSDADWHVVVDADELIFNGYPNTATSPQPSPPGAEKETRDLAAKHGISHTTVKRDLAGVRAQTVASRQFRVPPDPDLVEKIRDLVALYMSPPVAAAVFAIDEKPQIQALNRTTPTLPMLPTTPARATHDYERNGTCDLFAALDVATGTVITDIRKSHTSADFIAFLNKVNREVPAELDVHVILDNLQTHKTPQVHRWLLRHRRFHFHFTPTYGSWMNLVERGAPRSPPRS